MYLQVEEIRNLIDKNDLIIRPLLDIDSQLGEMTFDFRLGYDFLVSIQGREAYIDTSFNNNESSRVFENFFHKTRRRPGETILLHPNQKVLATSLEYVKIPKDVCLILNTRSSYSRLGLNLSTLVQPGYCGCLSFEFTNTNKVPINLTIGSRIVQGRFAKLASESNYFKNSRKYLCQVRPSLSAITEDKDLQILNSYWKDLNHQV